jgi:hypothetical protein
MSRTCSGFATITRVVTEAIELALVVVEQQLGQAVLGDEQVKRLLTINGVNINLAVSLIAAGVSDFLCV